MPRTNTYGSERGCRMCDVQVEPTDENTFLVQGSGEHVSLCGTCVVIHRTVCEHLGLGTPSPIGNDPA